MIPSIRTSKHLVPTTISKYCKQYQLHPTSPVTLERVLYPTPDIECIVDTVWHLLVILFRIMVKIPTVISRSAICAGVTLRNWMYLHPSNGCRYCIEPCSVSCWEYLGPNDQWIQVCDNCSDELPRLIGLCIHQFQHRSPYSKARVRQ